MRWNLKNNGIPKGLVPLAGVGRAHMHMGRAPRGGKGMDKEQCWELLMEKMDNDGCPVCELMDFRINESIENFLYESVNNPHIRYKIEKTNGFCNHHTHMMLRKGDPLSHAILYQDLMSLVISNIDNPKNKIKYNNHAGCMFCERERDNEYDYTKAFLEFFENSKFSDKYKKSGILCVPHLTTIKNIKFTNKKILKEIIDTTLEKYRILNSHLSEIKRKSDYRFTDEEWTDSEKEAWTKAVKIFGGLEGINR